MLRKSLLPPSPLSIHHPVPLFHTFIPTSSVINYRVSSAPSVIMSDESSPPLAGLPPDMHPRLEALLASDSPAALSASLSPYGVQDMTGEELQRYERSGAVSPADSRLSQSRHASHSEAIYPPTPAFRLVSERTTGAMHQCILVRSTEEEDDDDDEEEGQVTSEPSIRHGGDQVYETSIVSIKRKRSHTPALIHPLEHSTDETDQRASKATADGENEIDLEPSISDKDTEPRKRKRYPSADLDVAPLSKSKGPWGQEVSRFRGAIVCRSLKEAIDFAKSMGNGAPRTEQIHRHIFSLQSACPQWVVSGRTGSSATPMFHCESRV